ncbi:MAG TPA: aldo/keto reductase [Paracoccaceae bacterium]
MKKRSLSGSGLAIAPVVLGGNVFGWNVDQEASFALLDAFVDHGFDAIDTADSYSTWAPGNSGGELARPGVTAPIASATKIAHVESFARAVNLRLTEVDMSALTL